jgi:GNAT superfamily N-acetyltransferase
MTHGERIGLFEVKIACMTEKHQVEFEQILREYLPGSEPETVREKAENYSETCLVALKDEKVIGIAFGWPREAALPRKEYCLDGIAVRYEYWGKGVGGQLLEAFEEGMRKYGYRILSVGSAEGLAEKFYLKHGFVPQSFKVYSDGQIKVRKVFHSLDDYLCYKRSEEGFVVFEKDIHLYEDDFF